MARTVITPTTLTANTFVANGTGTAIAGLVAEGVAIPGPLEELTIEIEQTTASEKDATIAVGDNPPADASGLGTIVEAFAAGDSTPVIKKLGPLSSARFVQSGADAGKVYVDFETGMTGFIRVFRVPRSA
jgi:hypothetical protein